MAGDALLPSPVGRDRTHPDLLDLFAAAMLRRREPDSTTRDIAARARSLAREQVASARAPLGSQQMLALRSIYDEARACGGMSVLEATGESVLPGRTRAARTFEAMLSLRHRQRATVLLHDLGGVAAADIATVVGVRHAQVHAIVEAARAAVIARLKEPMNVRRALADAGRRILAPVEEVEGSTEPPVTLPRRVVRELLAPPVPQASTEAPPMIAPPTPRGLDAMLGDPRRLMDAALTALESSPADITWAHPAPAATHAAALRPSSRARLAPRPVRSFLVACCAVLAAVIAPATARAPKVEPVVPRVSSTVSTPAVVPARTAPPAGLIVADQVVVVAGDSLWAIAQRHLGEGSRWPEIWRLNAGAAMPGGHFTDPDLIRPGWRLRLPRR